MPGLEGDCGHTSSGPTNPGAKRPSSLCWPLPARGRSGKCARRIEIFSWRCRLWQSGRDKRRGCPRGPKDSGSFYRIPWRKKVSWYPYREPALSDRLPVKYHHSVRYSGWEPWSRGKFQMRESRWPVSIRRQPKRGKEEDHEIKKELIAKCKLQNANSKNVKVRKHFNECQNR